MTELRFRIVNVFTRERESFTGNPLCVFENAENIDERTMQALARQFNLSETTFIMRSSRADARVRIFTPSYEMPFAGHPTLGTAHVCRALGYGKDALQLEMLAGVIPVSASGDRWTLQAQPPVWREVNAARAHLAAMLSLAERDIGERPLWVKAGKEQLVIPLESAAAVRAARPIADLCAQVASEDGHSMAYVFAPTDDGRIIARFFFPDGAAMLEDPATGSATANLGGWFIAMQRAAPCAFEISQGEQANRPSRLFLNIDGERRIFVGGEVVDVASGVVRL